MSLRTKLTNIPPLKIRILLVLTATIATLGSLYLSMGLGLVPCKLCWYQRILMYPLPLILFYGFLRDESFPGLVLTMSGIGLTISLYHSFIQIASSGEYACSTMCSVILYRVGPLTVPNLAAIAFAMILTGTLFIHYYLTD